jgi:Ca2+-binding RTX toxin-like protein
MQGSGKVRDLREAATLSSDLKQALVEFSAATTRTAQLELVDTVLLQWAQSAGLSTMQERAAAAITGQSPNGYLFRWSMIGDQWLSTYQTGTDTNGNPVYTAEGQALIDHWEDRLRVVEAFNGRPFFTFPGETTQGARVGVLTQAGGAGQPGTLSLSLMAGHTPAIERSYQALRDSVYGALAVQTRLKPVLHELHLTVDTEGRIVADTSGMQAALQARVDADAVSGIEDLVDFARYSSFQSLGARVLESNLRSLTPTPELLATYAALGIRVEGVEGFTAATTESADIMVFGAGKNDVHGGSGADLLFGGAGNDKLNGGEGDDLLYGGAGSDVMIGGNGGDTFLFGRGDGKDTIDSADQDAVGAGLDTVQLGAGIAPTDVTVARSGQDLVLSINGTTSELRIYGYFAQRPLNTHTLDEIRFDDGTTWDVAAVRAIVNATSAGDDLLEGGSENDVFNGGGGNDTLRGNAGYDTLYGEDGNDTIDGGTGADTLDGGAGNDVLIGGLDGDVLDGGLGNDTLKGEGGSDTYRMGAGWGQDTISEHDWNAESVDTVTLPSGIAPADVVLTRDATSLIISVAGSTDRITVQNFFNAVQQRIERLAFADGTVWTDFESRITVATSSAASDEIYGSSRDDSIDGGDGNDFLSGEAGNDTLSGGVGAEALFGGAGDDTLAGGADNDRLYGGTGNDVLEGGAGNDQMTGEAGNDTYRFGLGSGQDSVSEYNQGGTALNVIELGEGITAADVHVSRDQYNLYLNVKGTADRLALGASPTERYGT